MSDVFDLSKPLDFKTIDEAIEVFVDVRDELRQVMKIAKAKEDNTKAFLDKISMWLRDKGDEIGVDSFKTAHGTAYRNVKKSYRVANWDDFIAYIMESGNTQLLEKRVAKRAAAEIHEHDNIIPPGLDYIMEVEFNVLRPKEKAE